jgi:arsenical pump membrane protein
VASSVTIVLGLDPTIVLLTPVVLVMATRLRMSPSCTSMRPRTSLLLPISNLTTYSSSFSVVSRRHGSRH